MRAQAHLIKYTRWNSREDSFPLYVLDPNANVGAALDPSGRVSLGEEPQTELETVASETSYVDEQASTGGDLSTTINSGAATIPAKSTVSSYLPTSRVLSASVPAVYDAATNTTTTSSSVPSQSSSTNPAPTSSSDSAQPSSTQPSTRRSIGLYGAIVFGLLIGVGVIVLVSGWWLRTRTRMRRRSMKRMTTWPWDHDRLGARAAQDTLESGSDGRPGLRTWDPARMVEASAEARASASAETSDGGKSRFSIEDDLPLPLPQLKAKDSPVKPSLPHERLDLHAYPRTRSPFVAVPLHANRNREQSVPDIMQEMGTLKITNLMPGDILTSGGESSRASTALGFSDASPDWEWDEVNMGSPTTPRATMDEGTSTPTPRLPWAPLRTWKTKGGWQEGHMLEDGDDEPMPFPGNSPVAPEPEVEPEMKPDGWAGAIRSNLVSALNAVVGGNASQARAAGTGNDNLTRPPERRSSQRRRGVRGRHGSADSGSHSGTASSASSQTGWTLEEIEGGRGVVRFRGGPEQGRSLTEDPFSDDSQVPSRLEEAAVQEQDGDIEKTFDRALGTTNGPPTDFVREPRETMPVRSHPPEHPNLLRLPQLPGEEESGEGLMKTFTPRRKRTKRRRPAMVTRKSSSESSAVSVGSDMSRASSVPSDELTDAERFAKHVLRERRRRVMEMAVGRGRPSRSKATTISRRRPKERLKQKMEREPS